MRKKIIAGNWKMYKTPSEAARLVQALKVKVVNIRQTEMVVCPPFVSLAAVRDGLASSNVKLGAQNIFWENEGAFTGEISAPMLIDAGCQYVIIGHSERRQYFHETNVSVNRRLKAALASGLEVIFCVGETLQQRDGGTTFQVIGTQLLEGLQDIPSESMQHVVVAYEPVWAIGTGRNASPEQAQEAHRFIRDKIADSYSRPVADHLRILYGGSVKPANADELLRQPDVDGALVGGASLDAASFAEIIKSAESLPG